MGVDIKRFREYLGADLKEVRESFRARGDDENIVDSIVEADESWRKAIFELEKIQSEVNHLGKQIGKLKKQKLEAKELISQVSALKGKKKALESSTSQKRAELDKLLNNVGNWVHKSVPVGTENKQIRTWGKFTTQETSKTTDTKKIRSHAELLAMIDGFDPKRGCEVGGLRGYFLKGYGMLLNHALQAYAIRFLVQRKYIPIQPPTMIRKSVMTKVAQLRTFDEDLYQVVGGKEDMYLAATSEQPLCALHANESLPSSELPIYYCGHSTCFRKELTSHGVDASGVFRVHQFEKVEQFAVCSPDKSWEILEQLLATSEKFYQSLNIPYQIVNIASKSLSKAAAKKYDLEGWFPSQGCCRELVSCSNCTDYQSRALQVRFGYAQMGMAHTSKRLQHVHMLNSTLCASQRTLCCLLENCQTSAGIRVPEPLVIYVGTSFIPFVHKEPPSASPGSGNKGGKKKKKSRRKDARD